MKFLSILANIKMLYSIFIEEKKVGSQHYMGRLCRVIKVREVVQSKEKPQKDDQKYKNHETSNNTSYVPVASVF